LIGDESANGDDRFANRAPCNRSAPNGQSTVDESRFHDSRIRNKDRAMIAKRRLTSLSSPRRRSGLSLIELAVVLVILVALAGLVIPLVTSTSDHAKYTATHATMARLRDVIMGQYRHDMSGLLPRIGTASGVKSLPNDPTGTSRTVPQLVFLFVNPGPTNAVDSNGNLLVDGNNTQVQINPANATTMASNTTISAANVPGTTTVTVNRVTGLGWRGPYLETSAAPTFPGPELMSHDPRIQQLAKNFLSANGTYGGPFGVLGDLTVLDGWNMPIILYVPLTPTTNSVGVSTTTISLISAGPDQTLGTSDDIILNLYTR
jgi:type II secretory pathway pseudopilin PulG